MTGAARAFIATLDRDQIRKAVLPLSSPEKAAWAYVPGERKGISWDEMTEPQRKAAHALLKVSLSRGGYEKIEGIRELELVLRDMEKNPSRDPNKYWLVFFGSPSSEGLWLWRYEGHHISLTFSLAKGAVIASTPQFLGSNPYEVRQGEKKGTKWLARERDLAVSFMETLTEGQRRRAVLSSEAPADIVTAAARKATLEGQSGISYKELDRTQQSRLRELIAAHAQVQTPAEQKRRLAKVEHEGYEKLVFAWMGPVSTSGRHYYRIQGPSFVIEYDCTQPDGNHVHTVWRDFKEDFGGDALAEHYEHEHNHR